MITGEQIKQAREEKNLSQEELSELLGVSRQAVSKWENGLSVPQGENRRRLTEVLELTSISSEEKGDAVGKSVPEDTPDGRLRGKEADPGEISEKDRGDTPSKVPGKAQEKARVWIGRIGWVVAVLLLAVLIGTRINGQYQSGTSSEDDMRDGPSGNPETALRNDTPEEPRYELPQGSQTVSGTVRFYDSDQKEVSLRDSRYNSADIDSILVQWTGEGAKAVNMYYCAEEDTQKELMLTQAVPAGDSAILLNGGSLGAYLQGQVFFEVKFPEEDWVSEPYNMFYDPTVMAYIRESDGASMAIDEVEWVATPGERATELGLVNEGSGFVVYNEKESWEQFPLAENCACTVLDWSENFVPKEVTPQELAELLAERDAPYIPYILTIEDGQIIAVQEQYVP